VARYLGFQRFSFAGLPLQLAPVIRRRHDLLTALPAAVSAPWSITDVTSLPT